MIEETLVQVLAAGGQNVYALQKPLDAPLPAIVYRRVSRFTTMAHNGSAQLHQDRYQIVCMAATYEAARTLRELVETRLRANRVDFKNSMALSFENVLPDDRDGSLRITSRDYYIWSEEE